MAVAVKSASALGGKRNGPARSLRQRPFAVKPLSEGIRYRSPEFDSSSVAAITQLASTILVPLHEQEDSPEPVVPLSKSKPKTAANKQGTKKRKQTKAQKAKQRKARKAEAEAAATQASPVLLSSTWSTISPSVA